MSCEKTRATVGFYPSNFLSKTDLLSAELVGAYMVFCRKAADDGGRMLDDIERLKRAWGIPKQRAQRIRKELLDAGMLKKDGEFLSHLGENAPLIEFGRG